MESVWAINSNPVLYKHEIIRAGQPAIRVLIFNMIEARGGLMTVEGAGDDAGVDDALGILVHGHGLIVNIYLDISAGNGEFFAISGTIDRRIEVGEVERKELGGEGLEQGRAVDGVIDLQEGNRNFFAGISGENIVHIVLVTIFCPFIDDGTQSVRINGQFSVRRGGKQLRKCGFREAAGLFADVDVERLAGEIGGEERGRYPS